LTALLARLRSLSAAETALLCEAALALALASFAVAFLPFGLLARTARRPSREVGADKASEPIAAVRWAITVSARRAPWRAKCLEQAFAAHWMLRRRAVPAVIHYGAARRERALIAHAWVRAGAVDVVGQRGKEGFVEIARFPR
jgi:hypothetical protein